MSSPRDAGGVGGQGTVMAFVVAAVIGCIQQYQGNPTFNWTHAAIALLPCVTAVWYALPPWFVLKGMLCSCKCWRAQHMTFHSSLKFSEWYSDSDSTIRNFSTLLWEWHKAGKTRNCTSLTEETIAKPPRFWWDEGDKEQTKKEFVPIFVDDHECRFFHVDRPEIEYQTWIDDRDGGGGGGEKGSVAVDPRLRATINLRVTFKKPSTTPNDVVDHINWLKSQAEQIAQRDAFQKVLMSKPASKARDEDDDRPGRGGRKSGADQFITYRFATTSTFEYFFADETKIVLKDLDRFLNRKHEYIRKGQAWNYTLLNAGPPGVGKTKIVKCIAAMTHRTVIVLKLSDIGSVAQLYECFHAVTLNGEVVPHENRLYYIPEIDTQSLSMLQKRPANGGSGGLDENARKLLEMQERHKMELDAQQLKVNTMEKEIAELRQRLASQNGDDGDGDRGDMRDIDHAKAASKVEDLVKRVEKAEEKKSVLSLGDILNCLDGMPERHGHILVLDTNHMGKIRDVVDPAFLRPGRVDRVLEWRALTSENAKQYVLHHFGLDALPAYAADFCIPDYAMTAASLQGILGDFASFDEYYESRRAAQRSVFTGGAPPAPVLGASGSSSMEASLELRRSDSTLSTSIKDGYVSTTSTPLVGLSFSVGGAAAQVASSWRTASDAVSSAKSASAASPLAEHEGGASAASKSKTPIKVAAATASPTSATGLSKRR